MATETIAFYACLNKRCRVRHWPMEAGLDCPVCGRAGYAAGLMTKLPDPPVEDADADSTDPVLP